MMLYTSSNVDFWMEFFSDVITYDKPSSMGMSQIFGVCIGESSLTSSLFSFGPKRLSRGICILSKFTCCGTCEFDNTRAGILSNIFGRFSCRALTVSSNEYNGGSFQPGVYAITIQYLNKNIYINKIIIFYWQ